MNFSEKKQISSEKLAYWYFRLNGFLTIVNFVVHPDIGNGQRTDVDILGVRFPYRAELLTNPMRDDDIFYKIKEKPYFIIAEVKTKVCNLNGPWTRPEDQNMQRVLKAIGIFKEELIKIVADSIYKKGFYENDSAYLTLFCVGNRKNLELERKFPDVPQQTFDRILDFIYERFNDYKFQKAKHSQWDCYGKLLWNEFYVSNNKEDFKNKLEITQPF